ncbi:MAG: T9SS type A sorting domain-containing protein, partial [Lentimicrobium sp.]|nr:T9SS type A sorting domain-containing protein [Lentimicrobium sp.]
WDLYNIDDATHLGSHTMSGGNSQVYVSGYENLNVGNVGSYTVTGLNPGTTYYYVVRAVNDAGTSANSNEISATTTLPAYVLVGAHDNASNYSSWVNTSDEGCGFGAWSLSSGGSGGSYLGGTALGAPTFGIYSGGADASNFFTAGRSFIDKMPVGSTFSFSLGYTGVSNGGSIGINLFSGINHRLTFKFVGGNSFWVINDGGLDFNTTIPWSGSTPLGFAFTRGSGNIYSLEITQGVATYIANNYIANSGTMDIDRIEIFTARQGSGENLGFDELALESDPLLIPAVSSVTVKGCVTLEDDLEVEDLTIESGNTLHISGLSDLTVNGTLTNNAGTGGLLLQSDGAATGSLIHHTANVPATVQLYLTGAAEAWHLLSSPVENQAVSGDFTPSGTYGDGTGYDLYAWDEPTETWLNQKTGSNNITSFVPAKGYLAAYQSVGLIKSFTGTLNEGIYLPAVSASGTGNYKRANLLGNPYPSSIDWKSVTGLDKSALEGYENGGVSFYVWNEAASNYGVYNDASAGDAGTNGTSRYIAPMQGFFVIAAQAGEFGMDNDARAHNAQAWLKSDSENEFRLTVTAPLNAGSDEVLLDFGHADAQGGAEKWYSMAATAPALYVPSAEKDYSIRFLSSVSDYPAIPLAFKAGLNGEYTLSAGFHPAAYSSVMLTDQLTGKVHDLKANPVYAFTAATGDDPGRFLLSFGSLGIEGPQAEDQIQIYACAGTLYLNTTSLAPAMVKVYNLTGQLVMEAQTAGHTLTALPAQGLSQGIYVVNVVAGDRVMSRKVAIRP